MFDDDSEMTWSNFCPTPALTVADISRNGGGEPTTICNARGCTVSHGGSVVMLFVEWSSKKCLSPVTHHPFFNRFFHQPFSLPRRRNMSTPPLAHIRRFFIEEQLHAHQTCKCGRRCEDDDVYPQIPPSETHLWAAFKHVGTVGCTRPDWMCFRIDRATRQATRCDHDNFVSDDDFACVSRRR